MFTGVDNVGLKQAGAVNLYVRGSNSRSQLKSIPVSLVVFDELDEMNLENIELAEERTSGQMQRKIWKISTPTIDEYGINYYFRKSTQEQFIFKCPSCSKHIDFRFPDSLVITAESDIDPNIKNSHLICYSCKARLEHQDKSRFLKDGKWIATKQSSIRGFHANQMYSSTVTPVRLATKYLAAVQDILEEQEFYNSSLGLTRTVKDAKITDEQYDSCIADYMQYTHIGREYLTTMGVDIGKKLHVDIAAWTLGRYDTAQDINQNARKQLLAVFELDDFEQLDHLMQWFSIRYCVCDSQPETRKALDFAYRHPGRVSLCRYNRHIAAKNLGRAGTDTDSFISVNRTSWLDLSLGRFKNNTVILPKNLPFDYKKHIQAQIRVPKRDLDGNPSASYETPGNRPDHYGHASNYSEIALPLAVGFGPNLDIT